MGVQLRALAGEHGSFWRARQQVRHVDSLCAFCSYERGGSKTERGGMCCCWSPPKRAELLRTDACAVCAPPPLPSLPLLRRGVGLQRMCMQPSKRQRRFYLHLRANHQCVPAITLSARPPTAILDSSSPLFCILPLSSFLLVPSRPAPTGQREVARHHPPLATGKGMPEQKHIAWRKRAVCVARCSVLQHHISGRLRVLPCRPCQHLSGAWFVFVPLGAPSLATQHTPSTISLSLFPRLFFPYTYLSPWRRGASNLVPLVPPYSPFIGPPPVHRSSSARTHLPGLGHGPSGSPRLAS